MQTRRHWLIEGHRSVAIGWLCAVTLAACGGARGGTIAVHVAGSDAGITCPRGTALYGNAPPDGTMLFCATPGGKGRRARNGPSITWACDRCKDGRSLRGTYVQGERDGTWMLTNKQGARIDTSDWKNGKRSGDWVGYYDDGTPHFRRKYDAGKLDGSEWSNHPNGTRELEGVWTENIKDGLWRHWNKNGVPTSAGEYDRGRKSGAWKVYDAKGNVSKLHYYDADKLVREGHIVNGQLRVSALDQAGKRTATWTERYGKRHGEHVLFHIGTEIPARTTTYADGVPTGEFILHRKDGTKRAAGVHLDGVPQCGWRTFDAKGREQTRGPLFAKLLAGRAAELGASVPDSPCKWTAAHAIAMSAGADVPTTVALGRWLMEHALGVTTGTEPPEHPPSVEDRLVGLSELVKAADSASAGLRFDEAALLSVAVLLEVDRALGGKVLLLPPSATAPGSPSWLGPMPDKEAAKAYVQIGTAQVKRVSYLLHEKDKGDKAVRKAGRITLGKIGIDRLTLRKFAGRIK